MQERDRITQILIQSADLSCCKLKLETIKLNDCTIETIGVRDFN